MMAAMKIAFMLAVVCLAFLMAADARRLLDWNDCNRGWGDWNDGGRRGEYNCGGRRWDDQGRWYGDGGWHSGREGFCVGLCG